ncbi:pericentriolar material 1 protein-like [Salmo trutta]|uniref:pericentriolar material 1 protein-like n=1 Tax=Salmo trutta TaxID=8032 RepID=UPI0011304072|nr:pericentriolar material 1 protein-like [Salmo trutta]
MTTLKSSKATTHVSLMFKHSLSSSKNKRKQSRGHRRTTDAGVTGGSLFEVLREAIYSEVANVISQNETRPCFIIVLFFQLQLLNTHYLRQRALFALKERVEEELSPGVHQTQGSGSDSREFIRFFHKQLSDVLQLRKHHILADSQALTNYGSREDEEDFRLSLMTSRPLSKPVTTQL